MMALDGNMGDITLLASFFLLLLWMGACLLERGRAKRVLLILTVAAITTAGVVSDGSVGGLAGFAVLPVAAASALVIVSLTIKLLSRRIASQYGTFDPGPIDWKRMLGYLWN